MEIECEIVGCCWLVLVLCLCLCLGYVVAEAVQLPAGQARGNGQREQIQMWRCNGGLPH